MRTNNLTQLCRFVNILLAGLVAGVLSGIVLGYNSATFSPRTYLEQQQHAISQLNTLMPVLGLSTILICLLGAFLQRNKKRIYLPLLLAAACLVTAGLITLLGNQPINALVMTWSPDKMPANWSALRDQWWTFHLLRTLFSVIAFCLVIWSDLMPSRRY